ncbi:Uncharacterized protein MSYG_2433 [Malassezia sympodialis ATCC 42132]|uniref:Uncharacterized protein n=1 Tax=Malassezia sympodialis (strain ATCC 42132) TaxID=1230383 RepID=A0A1M8A6Q7_MALS4|nr:Uncharacterized protein MSYG_2433 [Malassezia sympodialis ATCC 42132]
MEKEPWEGGVRRRLPAFDSGGAAAASPAGHMHQPGKPIGFLAARGTPYAKKILSHRLLLFTVTLLPIFIIFNLFLIAIPILWGVANHTLNVSVMHIYSSNLTSPLNDSFYLTLEGQVKKAGVFPAQLYFNAPVHIFWNSPPTDEQPMEELELGNMRLDRIGVAAGHGRLKQLTKMNITNQQGFAEFTKFLVTQPSFTWRLKCDNVHIKALGFLPTFKNLGLSKDVVINGMDNFHDVKILDFKLPGADPAGGISYEAVTSLTNPSPFGVQLGTLATDLFFNGVFLGPGVSDNLNITPGVNIVTLKGRLLPHNENQTELNILGDLFTKYLNFEISPVVARGVSVSLPEGYPTTWLSEGIKALTLNVPFQSPNPLNPIKSIVIKQFNLTYEADSDPYGPTASSNSLEATLALPFGFPLNILSTKNEITIVNELNGNPVISVNGVYSKAATQLNIVSAGQLEGTLFLTLNPSPMQLPSQTDESRHEFEQFVKLFTFGDKIINLYNGSSSVITDMPIGRVSLDNIKFSVESGLLGLQGLTQYPTPILGVDVVGGDHDGILLSVNTSIYNPSNVNAAVGDVSFLLVVQDVVGQVTIPNLNLNIGNNTVTASSKFNPKASPYGQEMLNRFVSGLGTPFNISGFDGSSKIQSLIPAFSAIRLNTTLPGLGVQLIQQASLKILSSTGITNDVAQTVVTLDNPFTAGLKITHIQANVTAHGLNVAQVDTGINFVGNGKSVSQSPLIDLHLNLYPPDIFALVRAYAIDAGLDTKQLDGIVKIGGYTYSPTSSANTRPLQKRSLDLPDMAESSDSGSLAVFERRDQNMYTGFNIADFVQKAFAKATIDMEIQSVASIGEYSTELAFVQLGVPLRVDQSLNMLLPVLAKPIVQKIIDGAALIIQRVTIVDPQPESFQTQLEGSITNSGPFDASISFPSGLQVAWNGNVLGQIKMPDIQLAADEGAKLNLMADFSVSNADALTEFTKYLVTNPSFIWQIQGQNLSVSALGIKVSDLTISKTVILSGMNNLKNRVQILRYDLPSNDPQGGIHLTATALIQNPSQVGVQLSRFGVNILNDGVVLGPSYAAKGFTLNAVSTTQLPLAGRLVRQSGHGLDVLSQVFTDVVHGKSIPVSIRGAYGGPSNVQWLNEGIKALQIQATLPAVHFNVIKAINLNQLTLMFSKSNAWTPSTSSNNTQAPFFLPFGFPIDIREAGGEFIENYHNQDIATLSIPFSQATTDVQQRIMSLQFSNAPMSARSNEHDTFADFIADTTAGTCVKFGLHGSANAKASTAAGYVTIRDIPFSVDTSLLGLQNLNARPATVSDLDVYHGYKSYLLIKVNAHLYNPSHITVGTGDVSFGLQFKGRTIGSADIDDLVIQPGLNTIPTDVHYSPQGSQNTAAGQQLLENYVMGVVSTANIQGSSSTTDIASLKKALAGISLTTQIPPLHQLLITEARLTIPRNIAKTATAEATFQLDNPFTASINLIKVNARAIYDGIYIGKIDQDLSKNPVHASGHSKIVSRSLPFSMVLDPKVLIRFIETAARNTGTDLGPLPPLFNQVLQMQSTKTSVEPTPDPNPPSWHSGKQFDVFGAILNTMKGLAVELDIQSTVKLDDYQTNLNFVQKPVPTDTDRSVLYLIGPVGAPIVQNLVNQATLAFQVANVSRMTDKGFHLNLEGSLLGTGPFDAQIEFPEGVSVRWQGKDIATIKLPPIRAVATEGVPNLITSGDLTITNEGEFTNFAKFILHGKSFTWTIHSDKLRVRALNIVFDKVKISKDVSFDAFNNLPGVGITSFDIPSDTSNALNIVAGTSIPSPASLGIDLETANFKIFFRNQYQGPIHGSNLFLAPHATTNANLQGQITQKKGNTQTNTTGELFSGYLQGRNQTLLIQGDSVVTKENGNKPVKWLSNAFKTLKLSVILPGHIYKVVHGIYIIDLFVTIMNQQDTWAPRSGTNLTMATFSNPFHFSLKPVKAGLDATLSFDGGDAGELRLPLLNADSGTSRGPNDLQSVGLSWTNYRLYAKDHGKFAAMISAFLVTPRTTVTLSGAVNLLANMPIGNIPINGVPFDNIQVSIATLNSFTGKVQALRADVTKGTPQYLDNKIQLILTNPSNITLHTTGIQLPGFFENYEVGRALLDNQLIVPGKNNVSIHFHFQPADDNSTVAQTLVSQYALAQPFHGKTSIPYKSEIDIHGYANANPPLSTFESLIPGLERLNLSTVITGLASRPLVRIETFIDLLNLFSGPDLRPFIYIQLTFQNDLPVSMQLMDILNESRITGTPPDGKITAQFHVQNFPGCVIPAAKSTKVDPGFKTCAKIHNVLLNQGLLGSSDSVGKNLDVYNTIIVRLDGSNGYVLNAFKANEFDVDTAYSIAIGDLVLFNVTKATEFIDGIGEGLKKMNDNQKTRVAQGLKGIGQQGIGKLIDNGFNDLVCGVSHLLTLDLQNIADCGNTTSTTSSSSSSTSAASSTAKSSGNSSISSSSKANPSPSGGQASRKSSAAPTSSSRQTNSGGNNNGNDGSNGSSSSNENGGQSKSSSSSQKGGLLGGIF